MRVILDTNVFVSGVFFGGVPGEILDAWKLGNVEIILTEEIVEEYVEVLHRLAARYSSIVIEPVIELLLAGAEVFSAPKLTFAVCADPEDDKFIAAALSLKINIIVSGDKHLLAVNGFRGIEVFSPADFANKYLR